ncbi:hypothetical protein EHQ97_00935 [Leptospira adleri]|nr:hypothetical protein EHQ97_00935 [Leptospira adleri]
MVKHIERSIESEIAKSRGAKALVLCEAKKSNCTFSVNRRNFTIIIAGLEASFGKAFRAIHRKRRNASEEHEVPRPKRDAVIDSDP